jgi:DNA repair exonuclease SbcCD ATPase subunit
MPEEDRFRFDLRDEEPEVSFNEEALRQRIATLNRRLSFLVLVLPLLLAIALYAGYQDLAQRTAKTQSAELRSVEKVTAEADQKMTAFETRLADFESALTIKTESEQKSVQALKDELRKGEAEIEKLGALKAEKKDLAEAATRTEAAMATLQKDLQTLGRELQALAPFREELGSAAALRNDISSLSSRLQRLENVLGKDLTGLAGYLERTKNDLEKIKTDLTNLQARKVDREAVELETLKTKRLYQMALDQEVARIDKTLAGLQRRLDQLEKAFGARSGSSPPLPPLTGGIKEQVVE